MDATPRLQLPYIAPQQAQKQVTYNEAMRALDLLVQPAVKSRSLAAPPASPAEGDAYIVAAGATGAWAGEDGMLATLLDGMWSFRAAADGWQLYVEDSAEIVIRQGGAWEPFVTNGGSAVAKFGINATPSLLERLAVASEASLFTHDGASHRLKLNKAASADTGSILFQTGYSSRAELGLAGDDDFHLKVSPDGAGWLEALTIARGSGRVGLPLGQLGFPAVPNPSVDPNTLDDYAEGTWTPGISFGGASAGVSYGALNTGRYTKIGRLCFAHGTLQLTSKGSSTGLALLTGLPFTTSSAQVWAACTIGYATAMTSITGTLQGFALHNDTRMNLYHSNNGSSAALSNANFTTASQIHFSIVYEAA